MSSQRNLNTNPELCVPLTRCVFLFWRRDSIAMYVSNWVSIIWGRVTYLFWVGTGCNECVPCVCGYHQLKFFQPLLGLHYMYEWLWFNNNIYLKSNVMSSVDYNKMQLQSINNNNTYFVVYSPHPYCCVNNIVLTLFLKQSKFDVLIC